jgi:hypothetical protein
MESADGALAAFLAKAGGAGPEPAPGGARMRGDALQILACAGDLFVAVSNPGGGAADSAAAASLALLVTGAVRNPARSGLLDRLPEGRRAAGSERAFRGPYGLEPAFTFGSGDVFSQRGRAFGVLAVYPGEEGPEAVRFRVDYADPEEAAAAFARFRILLDPSIRLLEDGPESVVFSDYAGQFGAVLLNGPVLSGRVRLTRRPDATVPKADGGRHETP